MSPYIFTKNIIEDLPLAVFNQGKMKRDFTYIDDVVIGVLAALDQPPFPVKGEAAARLYNFGNSHAENLMDFIALLEKAIGKKAKLDMQPMQPGDVVETFADIILSAKDLGYKPKTLITEGVPRFVAWYREYHKI